MQKLNEVAKETLGGTSNLSDSSRVVSSTAPGVLKVPTAPQRNSLCPRWTGETPAKGAPQLGAGLDVPTPGSATRMSASGDGSVSMSKPKPVTPCAAAS